MSESPQMITALIRTMPHRRELFERAKSSVESQGCAFFIHESTLVCDYSYNLYCNTLRDKVADGFYFYLDDDDIAIRGSIEKILPLLKEDHANIVQMLRNGIPKPRNDQFVRRGCIGGPCLILHSKYKHISDWTAEEWGDWAWIQGVIRQLPINFINIPLVDAGSRSHGK